jgi:O-antigen ligase
MARPETFLGRFDSFRQGARLIAENPILGVGLNNSTAEKIEFEQDRESIANHYLIVASETGVVGLILYLSIFGCNAAATLRLSKSRDPEIALLAIAIFGIYVSLSVHIVADQLVKVAATMVWLYAGVITALRRVEESNTESSVRETQTPKSLPSVLRSFRQQTVARL